MENYKRYFKYTMVLAVALGYVEVFSKAGDWLQKVLGPRTGDSGKKDAQVPGSAAVKPAVTADACDAKKSVTYIGCNGLYD